MRFNDEIPYALEEITSQTDLVKLSGFSLASYFFFCVSDIRNNIVTYTMSLVAGICAHIFSVSLHGVVVCAYIFSQFTSCWRLCIYFRC